MENEVRKKEFEFTEIENGTINVMTVVGNNCSNRQGREKNKVDSIAPTRPLKLVTLPFATAAVIHSHTCLVLLSDCSQLPIRDRQESLFLGLAQYVSQFILKLFDHQ